MGPKDMYLILYNSLLSAGWAIVWLFAVHSVATDVAAGNGLFTALTSVYAAPSLALMLTVCQSAALLEIFHAAAGLVRSPVMVTAMQVMSRIVALVAIVFSPAAQCTYIHDMYTVNNCFFSVK
jgi:very-long-chain (3R)-3-hydroxyacyl-CoA dehydratase